jgi:hypothetical protein
MNQGPVSAVAGMERTAGPAARTERMIIKYGQNILCSMRAALTSQIRVAG